MQTWHEQIPSKIDRTKSLLKSVGRYGTRKRKGKRKRKNPPDGERHGRKFLMRMSLSFSVASLALIIAAVVVFFRYGGASRFSNGAKTFAPLLIENLENKIPDGSTEPLSEEDAVELVRSALNSRDPASAGRFLILGDSATSPQKAIELLDQVETKDGRPHGFEYLGPKLASGGGIQEVMVEFENDGQFIKRLAQLRLKDDEWRMDLDSYTRHASPGWAEILARKCEAATVRVFVTPDNYYNGELYREDLWKCYALISPDVDEILFGYAERGSAQEKAMDLITSKEEEVHRASLKILTTREQGRMQFEISSVLADDWFIGETHFDESF